MSATSAIVVLTSKCYGVPQYGIRRHVSDNMVVRIRRIRDVTLLASVTSVGNRGRTRGVTLLTSVTSVGNRGWIKSVGASPSSNCCVSCHDWPWAALEMRDS